MLFWELDLTTRKAKDDYSQQIDFDYQQKIEGQVSEYIRKNFSFGKAKTNEWHF